MLENWREFPTVWNTPSNPQLFGHLLSQAGFDGVLFSSTRDWQKESRTIHSSIREFPLHRAGREPTSNSNLHGTQRHYLQGLKSSDDCRLSADAPYRTVPHWHALSYHPGSSRARWHERIPAMVISLEQAPRHPHRPGIGAVRSNRSRHATRPRPRLPRSSPLPAVQMRRRWVPQKPHTPQESALPCAIRRCAQRPSWGRSRARPA